MNYKLLNPSQKKKGEKVRQMLLKLSLLLVLTKTKRERRRMEERESLRKVPSPRRARPITTRKTLKKRSPKENVSTAG